MQAIGLIYTGNTKEITFNFRKTIILLDELIGNKNSYWCIIYKAISK